MRIGYIIADSSKESNNLFGSPNSPICAVKHSSNIHSKASTRLTLILLTWRIG